MKDLPKTSSKYYRQVAKEDPTLVVTINEETGGTSSAEWENFTFEIITGRIKRRQGVEISTSEPSLSTVDRDPEGPAVEGKSPNRHNRFYIELEPLAEEICHPYQRAGDSLHEPDCTRAQGHPGECRNGKG